MDRGPLRRHRHGRTGIRLRRQVALPHRHRRQRTHRLHPRGAGTLGAATRHGRARSVVDGLARRHAGQWPARLHRPRHRTADPRRRRQPRLRTGLVAEECRHGRRLSAADPQQHPASGLQVPRRALRLGPCLQRARLQRFRGRGLSQHGRDDAAQHQRPGREPGVRKTRLHGSRHARSAQRGRACSRAGRPCLHSRARDAGDRPHQRRALGHPRHHRSHRAHRG